MRRAGAMGGPVYMMASVACERAGAVMKKPLAKCQTSCPGHHMVSSTLALLKYPVIYMNVKQGSGPDRGRSPVEWGEIPFGRPSVHLSVCPPQRP